MAGGAFHIQIQKPKIKIQSIAMNDVASKKSSLRVAFLQPSDRG